MNISYRIVKVDPSEHGVMVRYWTDKVTEMDLATSLNPDGSIRLHADGYPLTTRTDMFMSIYQFPTPSYEQIKKDIILRAPIDWLNLQENVKDKTVDTKLTELKDHQGESYSFTNDDVKTIRDDMYKIEAANVNNRIIEADLIFDYANSDPKVASAFANVVIEAIHSGKTIPL